MNPICFNSLEGSECVADGALGRPGKSAERSGDASGILGSELPGRERGSIHGLGMNTETLQTRVYIKTLV